MEGVQIAQVTYVRKLGSIMVVINIVATGGDFEALEALFGREAQPKKTTEKDARLPYAPSADTISRGIWTGNVYTNGFAGITFDMPDSGWITMSDDEMMSMAGLGAEILVEAGMEFSLADIGDAGMIDMMAVDYLNNSNVIISYLKLNPMESLLLDETAYLQQAKEQYAQLGIIAAGDIEEKTLGKNTFYRMDVTSFFGEINYQAVYVCRISDCMIMITITSDSDNFAAIEAYFR